TLQGLHNAAEVTSTLKTTFAKDLVVSARGATNAKEESFVRRAVAVGWSRQIHHRQVVATKGDKVTVALVDEFVEVKRSAVVPVSPVAALIMRFLSFELEHWTWGEIMELDNWVLICILGQDGKPGTMSLLVILAGLLESGHYPTPTETCVWIDSDVDSTYNMQSISLILLIEVTTTL
uniref:Uncharacterized protein n=1 Tax=Globisporangium ultimum (strain ATCC 200006 / CBS 805.95 / DAOM BR144) TaxID=431595 RepID=K3WHA9_GLOUD